MGRTTVTAGAGILVETEGRRFVLDPRAPVKSGYAFVSHAHVDHVHVASKDERVIASPETRDLARARGFELGATVEGVEGVELLDSGHILGSRAIAIGDELFYTGDASGRARAFLGKCRTKKAKILVTETTYGSPEYEFPQTAKLVREVNGLISAAYDRGTPVVLMGYPLGKAQLLAYLFPSWEPMFYHQSVADMNKVHVDYGVELKSAATFDPKTDSESLPNGPWVMVAPMSSGRSKLMAHLKKKYGALLVAFSGWAVRPGYSSSIGSDYSFPLSDHCDYRELVELVRAVAPEAVYTTHGFAREFASDLRKMGFDARPLAPYQRSISEFAV